MDREELEAKAKELGVEFNEDTSDDDLNQAIAAKTKKEDDSDDPEYYKSELKKVIAQRDREKSDKRKLQNKLTELETKMKDFPDASDYEDTKKKYDELLQFKKEIETQREEEDLKNKTEFERAEISYKKQIKEMQEKFEREVEQFQTKLQERDALLQQREKKIEENRKLGLEKDVLEFAAKYKAHNPQQIVRLLTPDFEYDDKLEKWVVLKKKDGKIIDELDAHDHVKSFLEDEANSNLVRADVNTSGTGHRSNTSVKETASTATSKKYDLNDASFKEEAELRGLSVEDYAKVLEVRDNKMKKIEENRSGKS